MSKVAVITMGVKLDGEKGYTRFRYLCEFLVKKGYEVDLITTTFQHWEKKQRDLESVDQKSYPFGIKFIYEPGYRKNIDLRRVRSHKIAAENLRKLLEKEGDYDLSMQKSLQMTWHLQRRVCSIETRSRLWQM